METKLHCYTFFLDVQPIANSSKIEAFNLFKLLELFEGKIVLDANDIDPDQMVYLTEFKQKLNEHIAKETEKRQKELDKIRKKEGVVINTDDPNFIRQTFSHLSNARKNIK